MFVKLMADYSSSGVWNEHGSMMELHDLPLSTSLIQDIEAWTNDYEGSEFYLDPKDREVSFNTLEFNARGEELARRMSVQLTDWSVVYHPE